MTSPIRRVGLVAKPGLTEAADLLGDIGAWLVARGIDALLRDRHRRAGERAVARRSSATPGHIGRDEQLIIVLGGDGTLLGTAGRLGTGGYDVPVVAVNFGSLGFLTEVRVTEIFEALAQVLAGTAHEERRMMLEAIVRRADGTALRHISLNDVVITKGALSRMIDLVGLGRRAVDRALQGRRPHRRVADRVDGLQPVGRAARSCIPASTRSC